jgi:hypothetical protein
LLVLEEDLVDSTLVVLVVEQEMVDVEHLVFQHHHLIEVGMHLLVL